MPIPGTARTLLVVGRLVAFVAAAFALALMAKPGYELFPRCVPGSASRPARWPAFVGNQPLVQLTTEVVRKLYMYSTQADHPGEPTTSLPFFNFDRASWAW